MSKPTNRAKRRWFQFSLRSLFMLAALVSLGALAWRVYVAPYHRQRQIMALVERLGGSCQTAQAPTWLRRLFGADFQNVVLVNLADCDDPAKHLDHVSALPALETLVVGGPAFTDDHLRRLHRLTTLRALVLDSTNVTDSGLAALRDALPQVEVYESQRRTIAVVRNLGGANVRTQVIITSHAELRQLVGVEWFEEATEFLARNIGDSELALLRRLPQLNEVYLRGNQVSDDAMAYLTGLTQLQKLYLLDTRVGDAGLAHLAKLSQLQILEIESPLVSNAGLAHLAGLSQLQWLILGTPRVDDAGLRHLTELRQLQVLHLDSSLVSNPGMSHLKALSQLRSLYLDNAQVSGSGMLQLKGLKSLETLLLRRTRVTAIGAAELRRAMPNCVIIWSD